VTQVVLQDGDRIRIGTNVVLKFAITDELDEQFQHQMLQAAVIDGLTGLYNRRRLMEQLDLELQHSQRYGTPLTLVMLDLDHFKQVNDTHGHTVGDAVLQGFAQLLSSATRTDDMAARLGGEEFVLLCRNLNSLVGAGIADRLCQLVARSALAPTRPELRITVSAGVASVPDPRIQTADQLLEAADRALYAAKASGRNQVCIS